MFSAASIAEEKSLPFQMNTNHIPLQNDGDGSVLFTALNLTLLFFLSDFQEGRWHV